MKKLLSLTLCFVLLISLVACGSATETEEFTPVTDGASIGEGAASFPLSIVDKEGGTISITVKTDKETVGEALVDTGIIEGEEGPYGIYIKSVNGIYADFETDGTYWAFYINGEYAQNSVDLTPIAEGEIYMLKVES